MISDWHVRLALRQELAVAEEELTGWLLEELDHWREAVGAGPESQASGLTVHQFAELLAVAEENESVEMVLSHLRYQIAQSKEGKGWRYQGVGAEIVTWLEADHGAIYATARQAADNAAERVHGPGHSATSAEVQQAWVQLTRLFLAVLCRRFAQRAKEAEEGGSR